MEGRKTTMTLPFHRFITGISVRARIIVLAAIPDANKLLISLLTMRRFEAEYRLSRSTLMQTVFFDEFKKFQLILDDVVGSSNWRGG